MRELQLALLKCCPDPKSRQVPEQLVQVPLWLVYAAEQGVAAGAQLRDALDATPVSIASDNAILYAMRCYDAQAKRHNDGIAAMGKPAERAEG